MSDSTLSDSDSFEEMTQDVIEAYDMMAIHELLNLKTLGLAKAKAMDGMISDADLKALIQENIHQSLRDLYELSGFLGQARRQLQTEDPPTPGQTSEKAVTAGLVTEGQQ